MYSAIQSMYDVVKTRVRAGGDLTQDFMCPRGQRSRGRHMEPDFVFSSSTNLLLKLYKMANMGLLCRLN